MKGKTKILIIVVMVIITLLVVARLFVSVSSQGPKGGKNFGQIKNFVNVTVVGTKVKRGNIQKYITLAGDIRGISEAQVFADVPGKIAKVSVIEGQYVTKDQPLIYVDRSLVGYQYNLSPVRSPISGRVGSISVSEGQSILQSTPLALVVDDRIVEVQLLLPESYYTKIKKGSVAIVEVPSLNNEKIQGYVYSSDIVIDRGTRTLKVRVRVNNPNGKLISGMYVDVKIPIETALNTTYVPVTSIREVENKTFVYVLSETNVNNGKLYNVSIRSVSTGVSDGDNISVSGVKEGEIVVSLGAEYLKDGIVVRAILQ